VKFGSLFSGIGGLDLGLEMAGMECSWMVEVEKFGSQILKHHWPNAEIYGDIYTIDGKELESVDLICGGFPCQPVSVAGKRSGTSDERWLWGEFARIIRQVKPRWVVAENVTGLLSANSGRAFAEVLRDLAEGGYDAVWNVFPAGGQGGVGAPHRRERIFIIAKLADTDSVSRRRSSKQRRITKQELQQNKQKGSEMGSQVERCGESCGEAADVADSECSKHIREKRGRNEETGEDEEQKRKENSPSRFSRRASEIRLSDNRYEEDVADSKRIRQQRSRASRKWSSSETHGERQTDNAFTVGIDNQWSIEPDVGRVANGVPNRMDRLKALGNAVVPQVARQIGEMIMEME